MGGTCNSNANAGQIATAVLTIPQIITTGNQIGTIAYKYHNHTDSCKTRCNSGSYHKIYTDDGGQMWFCERGHWDAVISQKLNWGQNVESCPAMIISCGYAEGQIIGAEITY